MNLCAPKRKAIHITINRPVREGGGTEKEGECGSRRKGGRQGEWD